MFEIPQLTGEAQSISMKMGKISNFTNKYIYCNYYIMCDNYYHLQCIYIIRITFGFFFKDYFYNFSHARFYDADNMLMISYSMILKIMLIYTIDHFPVNCFKNIRI